MTTRQKISHQEFTQQVVDLAHWLGWKVAGFRPGMTTKGWRTPVLADGQGFPDLVLVRDEDLLFFELKTNKDIMRPYQIQWRDSLLKARQKVFTFYPDDFDTIKELLE